MTNQQVLEKAIKKAIANGLDWGFTKVEDKNGIAVFPLHRGLDVKGDLYRTEWHGIKNIFTPAFIFNHDFAKAIWGEEKQPYSLPEDRTGKTFNTSETITHYLPAYKYHLQRMVIAPDPIQYLCDNM